MILGGFVIGMILAGLTLAIIHHEPAKLTDKFGSAVAMFAGWCGLFMLVMAGTYGLGLIIPALLTALVLTLRTSKLGAWALPLAPYKLPLGVGTLFCSVAAWIGVLNLMEDIPNG